MCPSPPPPGAQVIAIDVLGYLLSDNVDSVDTSDSVDGSDTTDETDDSDDSDGSWQLLHLVKQ